MNPLEHDLMSLDNDTPLIDTSPTPRDNDLVDSRTNGANHVPNSNDSMSVTDEKTITPEDGQVFLDKLLQAPNDLEVLATGHHDWHITDWASLDRKVHSPWWSAGGHRWRLLLFPSGNTAPDTTAAYLECLPEDIDPETPPEQQRDWACCAMFGIALWNCNKSVVHMSNVASHRFTNDETDWGFSRLYDIRKLGYNHDGHDRPLLEHGELMISSYVKIVKDPTGVLWHNFNNYDSKKVTGMVGLKNQGATCYMNSLLQSLYFTTYFRKAVYQIPTENDDPTNSIALALQRIFYQMEKSEEPASTLELTQSFGWNSLDAFMQHDVQEFNRVLQDNLEGKMKKTKAENALSRLFVGKMKSYIKCVGVNYESAREEEFWDIQLNVKGLKDLRESFKDYVQVETLDGDNKYFAEGYGLQDAKKGVIFQNFPPVLHLQLKRFEYDMERDAMVKINDRHEFPLEIDLKEFLDETSVDPAQNYNYKLHGVLVHSGDLHGGHYYALLKPKKDGKWYKFDDDRVTPCTLKEVLDENFGGGYPAPGQRPNARLAALRRSMNAYMLVYVQETRQDEILGDVADADIPKHVSERIERELAEEMRWRKEREEMHLYLQIRVIRESDFQEHTGFDLTDYDPKRLESHKVLKTLTYGEFKEQAAKTYNVAPERIRHWVMVNRQNKTIRPDVVIGSKYDVHTLAELRDEFGPRRPEFLLYLEILDEEKLQMAPLVDGAPDNTHFMLFVKLFDVERQTMNGLCVEYMHRQDKIEALVEKLSVHFPDRPQLKLFEEIKPGMIEPLRLRQTFQQAEIVDGDIVCVQRVIPETDRLTMMQAGKFSTAQDYYDFVQNKVTITLLPKPAIPDPAAAAVGGTNGNAIAAPPTQLTLSKKMQYDTIAAKIAEHLGVEASHLRLWTVSSVNMQPKQYVKPIPTTTLSSILQPAYLEQPSESLMYEVLEMTLKELEMKKVLKVSFLPEGVTKEVPLDLLVAKTGFVSDALSLVRAKVEGLSTSTPLRMYEVHNHRYHRELESTVPVVMLHDFSHFYVEMVRPEVDERTSEEDRLVNVLHFQKDMSRLHGIPFRFWLKPGEYFADMKVRLAEKAKFNADEVKRIKVAVVNALPAASISYTKPHYLLDDDVPYDLVRSHDDALGIDHLDRSTKPRAFGDAAVRIRG